MFRVEGLDCADCALKVEKALSGVPGVVQAQVSFASGKAYLHLEVPGAEKEAERVVSALGYRLRPEGEAGRSVFGPWRWALASGGLLLLAFLASFLLPPGLASWGYGLAALVGVFPLARRAVAVFRQNPFSMQTKSHKLPHIPRNAHLPNPAKTSRGLYQDQAGKRQGAQGLGGRKARPPRENPA